MELEMTGIGKGPVQSFSSSADTTKAARVPGRSNPAAVRAAEVVRRQKNEEQKRDLLNEAKIDAERYLQDILNISQLFNRRLKFRIDSETEQVIVKVIDGETDKVIKEIPPQELQRLYRRMKEAIGLIIDEKI
jgi:flagellar protein FlaG